jgi:hypothetical protein
MSERALNIENIVTNYQPSSTNVDSYVKTHERELAEAGFQHEKQGEENIFYKPSIIRNETGTISVIQRTFRQKEVEAQVNSRLNYKANKAIVDNFSDILDSVGVKSFNYNRGGKDYIGFSEMTPLEYKDGTRHRNRFISKDAVVAKIQAYFTLQDNNSTLKEQIGAAKLIYSKDAKPDLESRASELTTKEKTFQALSLVNPYEAKTFAENELSEEYTKVADARILRLENKVEKALINGNKKQIADVLTGELPDIKRFLDRATVYNVDLTDIFSNSILNLEKARKSAGQTRRIRLDDMLGQLKSLTTDLGYSMTEIKGEISEQYLARRVKAAELLGLGKERIARERFRLNNYKEGDTRSQDTTINAVTISKTEDVSNPLEAYDGANYDVDVTPDSEWAKKDDLEDWQTGDLDLNLDFPAEISEDQAAEYHYGNTVLAKSERKPVLGHRIANKLSGTPTINDIL